MSQSCGPDPELELERDGAKGWPGSSLPLLPRAKFLGGKKTKIKKKISIPGCETSFQARRDFGNAGASPQLTGAYGKRWKQRDELGCN